MISIDEAMALLELAISAARQAGDLLAQRKPFVVRESSRHDTKISADTDAEDKIFEVLRAGALYSIFSEEAGGQLRQGPNWIVDPLDGTVNYSRGIPVASVSIALWSPAGPVLGVVYDFNRGELFSGVVGKGAWLNGNEIKTSALDARSQSIIFSGFPVASSFDDQCVVTFISMVKQFKKVRLIGSAALSLAYVACGRGDAYFERDIRFWDVAGGLALVSAAGGRIAVPKGDLSGCLTVYADNGQLSEFYEVGQT